jgi:hypothetical protein
MSKRRVTAVLRTPDTCATLDELHEQTRLLHLSITENARRERAATKARKATKLVAAKAVNHGCGPSPRRAGRPAGPRVATASIEERRLGGVSELRVWQRRHATGVVAQVTPVPGMGTWDVCAWHEADREDLRTAGRFGVLSDAMAAADDLAIASAVHACSAECGRWEPIERRKSAR